MSRSTWRGGSGWVSRFWFALEYNDQRTLRQLMSQGININHTFKEPGHRRHGQTPIFIAVAKNNRELVSLLLGAGCNLEHNDQWGETPLFLAVRQGKISMVRQLISAGSDIYHRNNRGESVIFIAIKNGRKDLTEYLLSIGAEVDVIGKDGTTPLLLALELFENGCELRRATRKSAPSNMADILLLLIPVCSNLNHQYLNRGSALQISLSIETKHFHTDLKLSKLLMQQGAVPDRRFFLRFGGLNASTSKPGSEFFTEEFFNLALTAGANLQRERIWLLTVLTEMSQELQPYEDLFRQLLDQAMTPPSLQTVCVIYIRRMLGGPLWAKLDQLPLPMPIIDCLKLKHLVIEST